MTQPPRFRAARAGLLSALLLLAAPAAAHDFWMEPVVFGAGEGEVIPVRFRVGHSGESDAWRLHPERVIGLRAFGPNGVIDLQSTVDAKTRMATFDLPPGAYVVSLESQDATSVLEAERFNDFVADEGITPIALHRVRTRATDAPGRERYSRRGKTLLRVGDPAGHDTDHLLRPLGLTLDLVPEADPLALGADDALPVRVFYRGAPTPGVSVRLHSLDDPDRAPVTRKTDASGRVSFPPAEPGNYAVFAVWSAPLETVGADAQHDYDTIFASLTFERG